MNDRPLVDRLIAPCLAELQYPYNEDHCWMTAEAILEEVADRFPSLGIELPEPQSPLYQKCKTCFWHFQSIIPEDWSLQEVLDATINFARTWNK